MKVTLHGFDDIQKALDKLSREEATKAGQSANRAGATVLKKKVAAEAPNSPKTSEGEKRTRHNKGGTTREETHYKIANNVKIKKTKNTSSTKVQNSVFVWGAYHAHFVEFGSIHNYPNPFFTAAINGSKQEVFDAMKTRLAKLLIKKGVL